jgi:hypothetical protein
MGAMTMTRKAILSVLAGAMAITVWAQAPVQAQTMPAALGSIRLTRGVMADGKALPAGSYALRVGADPVTPVKGQGPDHAKWVEFVQGGQVKGRELASVVPQAEVKEVVEGTAPAANGTKVELLKGGEYLRVWANRGGRHYLVHLPVGK